MRLCLRHPVLMLALISGLGCGGPPRAEQPTNERRSADLAHRGRALVIETFRPDGTENRLEAERGRYYASSGFVELEGIRLRFTAPRKSALPGMRKRRGTHQLRAPSAVGQLERREFHIFGPAWLTTPRGDRLRTSYAWYLGSRSLLLLPAGGELNGTGTQLTATSLFFLEREGTYELFDVRGRFLRSAKKR